MGPPDSTATASGRSALAGPAVRRVFGEPYAEGGVTVIPVARLVGRLRSARGWARRPGSDTGADEGVQARPLGVYVIRDGTVTWQPAMDITRVVLGGEMLGALAILGWIIASRRRPPPVP